MHAQERNRMLVGDTGVDVLEVQVGQPGRHVGRIGLCQQAVQRVHAFEVGAAAFVGLHPGDVSRAIQHNVKCVDRPLAACGRVYLSWINDSSVSAAARPAAPERRWAQSGRSATGTGCLRKACSTARSRRGGVLMMRRSAGPSLGLWTSRR
jgi:hypothetical protein